MIRAALLMLLVGGCATRRAEPLETPRQIAHAPEPTPEPAPPPPTPAPPDSPPVQHYRDPKAAEAMAALDPTEYVRWPLGANTHPALEPAYAIASVFADPGVSWLDLCRLGAQNRRGGGSVDQLEYLRAWCDVANHDPGGAVARLAPLVRSSVLGMPAAVRNDLANIVVDAGGADEAQRLLSRARVDEIAIFDLVSASYAEVGRPADAAVFNERAIDGHDQRHRTDHCMRLARRVLLANPSSRTMLIEELAPFEGITGCASLYHELACWNAQSCDRYLMDHGVGAGDLDFGSIYGDWPAPTAPIQDWLTIARRAMYYSGDESLRAATSALEAGLRSAKCRGIQLENAQAIARDVYSRTRESSLRQRLDLIVVTPEAVCRAL